jgi:hypothetical protein
MKKQITILAFLILASLVGFMGFDKATLFNDFVSFDQAFIPPLAITNQEKVKPSKKAMKILKAEWATFSAKYKNANAGDPQWAKDFDDTDTLIKKAGQTVKSGKNLMAAHETLEEIRLIFMKLRQRNQMAYMPDLLTEFHPHMEALYHAAIDHSAGELDADTIHDMQATLAEALTIWKQVKETLFAPADYGIGSQKAKKMKKLQAMETKALGQLKIALEGNDKPAMIKAAKGIKPSYAKLYKSFGNFERIVKK